MEKTVFINKILDSKLMTDAEKLEYIKLTLSKSDEEVKEALAADEKITTKAICPPHAWDKTVFPWRCFACGMRSS